MDRVEVVWERFLVAVDVVALVDVDDGELERWPAGDLYERLVLAGVPVVYDLSGTGPFGGRPDYVELLVAMTADLVVARRPDGLGEVEPLPPTAAGIVLDWYRRNVDAC